ncbi:GmrSD restriction endonuclease domain-containing protein [Bacillus cereus]
MDKLNNNDGRLHRRNLDISFNELYDMYNERELIIQPEFQRLFRWTEKQQSLFIESLLLDMPIPPIYVDEQNDGSYILVDGLQRISSYLNFRGIELSTNFEKLALEANDNQNGNLDYDYDDDVSLFEQIEPGFKLTGCEIRKDLNGKTYDELSIIDRRNLKRVFIRVEVLTNDNEKSIKYHMFKRLNSGGALLSQQELRNSNIRMIDEKFINFINELANNTHFISLTRNMKPSHISQMKRSENILRYFLFKNKFLNNGYNRDSFRLDEELTNYLEEVTEGKVDFNYEKEKYLFENLVEYLDLEFGADIFGGVTKNSSRITQSFVQYNFDGFMLYFSDEGNQKDGITIDHISSIKKQPEYLVYRTGGIENVKSRITLIKKELERV